MCLSLDFPTYFQDNFAGDERGYKRYKEHFDKLGSLGAEKGRGITSITVGVLEILRGGDLVKLRALVGLSGEDCFNDISLHLEACKSFLPLLEQAHEAGEVTEEEVLDAVHQLGDAHMWKENSECKACYVRAKEGFVRLLGEDSAKAVNAAYKVAGQIPSIDEKMAEFRRLWEIAKVSLPEEAVTYDIVKQLGIRLGRACTTSSLTELRSPASLDQVLMTCPWPSSSTALRRPISARMRPPSLTRLRSLLTATTHLPRTPSSGSMVSTPSPPPATTGTRLPRSSTLAFPLELSPILIPSSPTRL